MKAPLLTINPSVLLFNQIQAYGGIINQSQAPAGTNLIGQDVTGLRVSDGKSLLLVGGNINIDGGSIRSYGGNVELGGLAAPGNVGLNIAGDNLGLVIPKNVERADVSLSNSSVHLEGKGNGGNITINAGDTVKIDGVLKGGTSGFDKIAISNLSSSLVSGEGKGGNIEITTGSLSVTNGAFISGSTDGKGNGGNITINARDTVTLDGGENGLFALVGTSTANNSVGNAGDIRINARELFLKNGGGLAAFSSGQGNGGNIFIDTRNAVIIDGISGKKATGVSSFLGAGGVGKGGDIQITTNSLTLSNGGLLAASSLGKGNAGDIIVNAGDAIGIDGVDSNGRLSGAFTTLEGEAEGRGGNINLTTGSLSLTNGGIVNASTFARGDGGNITIDARDRILIDGVSTTGSASGLFSTVNQDAVGNAGNINLTTDFLFLNRGGISSSSFGQGKAGDLNINSASATLDNKGIIAAITNSGDGGNINLTTRNLLLLRRGSGITTSAGTAQSGGNGGNIDINSKFIIGIREENSDIAANAFTGTGGNVEINSQGIFGIEARPKPTDKSDITASSELGVAGGININSPDNSSILNSFTELSPVIDTNALIANSCISRGTKRQENSFTITGSGALTTNRPGVLVSNYTTGEVRGVETTSRPWKKGDLIIEPQGLYRLGNGQLLLSRECSN